MENRADANTVVQHVPEQDSDEQYAEKAYAEYEKRTQSNAMVWWILIGFLILIVAIGVVGGASILRGGGTAEPQTVVDHYYQAIEKHDYATANSYLHLQNSSDPQLSHLTPTSLQLIDQAYSQPNGPITQHSVKSQAVRDTTADITVGVQRTGKSSTNGIVTLQLQQMDDGWKITSVSDPTLLL